MNQKPQKNLESFTNSTEAPINNRWHQCRVGITGASGSLGQALSKRLKEKGAFVVGLTHGTIPDPQASITKPNQWVNWKCGEEKSLQPTLAKLNILILNHGINPKGLQSTKALNEALEVNALSTWRLIEQFENSVENDENDLNPREIWINTSEAEIQPALSPAYEVSKRLIGQLVSIKWNNLNNSQRKGLKIRKLILGPFLSELNPIGIMSANFVANQVIRQVELGLSLIIVTPNPITYIFVPLTEMIRAIYSFLIRKIYPSKENNSINIKS
ncbi:SDR family oxidoreductase [Prochlorococcus sp. MIT 1307]|uniref:SDR family oxidoreductase n=1 Tax=Prochlorococcus sp. MIT 1307 TaxID=3096219 RepID=UPI002A75627A|nr:SDR family oxidoreductase [Prochlorococcus sp. MIT 1307]